MLFDVFSSGDILLGHIHCNISPFGPSPDLEDPAKNLSKQVGLSLNPWGNTVQVILAVGAEKFHKVYHKGGSQPVSISLPNKGVGTLGPPETVGKIFVHPRNKELLR